MADTLADRDAPEDYLAATPFLDSDDPDVVAFARRVCEEAGAATDRDKAVALFLAVRDGWRYDPYSSSREAED